VSWFTLYCDVDRYGHNQPPAVRARWRQHVEAIPEDEVRRWTGAVLDGDTRSRGHWIRRSPDGGHTWEEPQRVIPSSPHGPIELADGRLIYLGNDGYDRVAKSSSLIAAESHDKGRNWVTIARIDMWPGYPGEDPEGIAYLCEPHCVEVRPGHLLAMARYEEQPSREVRESDVLWQFESPDGGHTWTAPRPTKILGKPPHLTALDDGRILLSYGYRHPPYGERARLSRDGGRSWDETGVILRADAPNGDLGYPASVELDDGTVLTIYYQVDRPGEKTCLMTTRWMPGR
jgi:sialidase-1